MQPLSGLVLAGFRSLDEREDRYKEAREVVKVHQSETPSSTVTSRSFFDNILNKTKSLLIDDLDGNKS